MTPPRSLLRSALIGLSLGLILSGIPLTAVGMRGQYMELDCAGLYPEECALEQGIVREWSRMQLLAGLALTLLGIGGLLWQRGSHRRQGAGGEQPSAEE